MLHLRAPPARARPPELVARLEKLQGALDDRRYAAMVADVTAGERRLAELTADMFPTTRLQLSFGLHVVVTMGAFFALGFYGARFATGSDAWVGAGLGGRASWGERRPGACHVCRPFRRASRALATRSPPARPTRPAPSPSQAAAGGALGMAAALLLETLLLIVRSNLPEPLERRYAHLLPERPDWRRAHAAKLAGGGQRGGGGSGKGDGAGGGGGGGREKKVQ
jgi:hypothetical protein